MSELLAASMTSPRGAAARRCTRGGSSLCHRAHRPQTRHSWHLGLPGSEYGSCGSPGRHKQVEYAGYNDEVGVACRVHTGSAMLVDG